MVQDSGPASSSPGQRPRSAFERASMDIECASQDVGSASSEQHTVNAVPPDRKVREPTSATRGAVCRTEAGAQCASAGASAAIQPRERGASSQPQQPQGACGAAWDAGWPGGAQDDSTDLDAEMALLMDAAAASRPRQAPRPSDAEAGPSSGLPQLQARAALAGGVGTLPSAALAGGTASLPGAECPLVRRRAGWRLTALARWRACATPCWRRRTRAVRGCCACCARPTAARSSRTCAMAGRTRPRAQAILCTSLLQWRRLLAACAVLYATAAQARQGFLFLTGRAGRGRSAFHHCVMAALAWQLCYMSPRVQHVWGHCLSACLAEVTGKPTDICLQNLAINNRIELVRGSRAPFGQRLMLTSSLCPTEGTPPFHQLVLPCVPQSPIVRGRRAGAAARRAAVWDARGIQLQVRAASRAGGVLRRQQQRQGRGGHAAA